MFLHQVSRIKERVEEKEGIPPVQQRLIFGGKQMYVLCRVSQTRRSAAWGDEGVKESTLTIAGHFRADDRTAAEYNLEGGATLHLVLALRGGF